MVAQVVDLESIDHAVQAIDGLPHREAWIVAETLEIDHRYQRQRIRESWITKIAGEFDPDLFHPLLVNQRRWDNNRLFVMDGQHRLLAILRMGWGDQKVPCLLYDNLSYAMEAKLFNRQGATKSLTAGEQFRAALEQGKIDHQIIDGLVSRAGYQLNFDQGDMTDGRIPGVASLLTIFRSYKASILGETLEACRDGFGTAYGPRAAMLLGMAKFISRYRNNEHYDARRLTMVLKSKTLDGLLAEGHALRKVMSCHLTDAIGYKVLGAYNNRLRDDRRLPDWKFGRGTRTDERKAA